MDAEDFRKRCMDARRTPADLVRLRDNARAKGRDDLSSIAQDALESRLQAAVGEGRRGTSTRVSFRGDARIFGTAKLGYVWLIEQFIIVHPQPFQGLDWQLHFVAAGRHRHHFARTPEALFDRSPALAADSNNFARLSNGWVADVNLSNQQKFGLLCRVAAVAELQYDVDWTWDPAGKPGSRS
jgi:hypothetical protein